MFRKLFAVAPLFMTVALACSSDAPKPKPLELLDSAVDADAEERRLHDMQKILVVDEEGKISHWNMDAFVDQLAAKCGLVEGAETCPVWQQAAPPRAQVQAVRGAPKAASQYSSSRTAAECGMRVHECYARSLLASVTNPEKVLLVENQAPMDGGPPKTFYLLPQGAGPKAAIAEQALTEFAEAMRWWTVLFGGLPVEKSDGTVLPAVPASVAIHSSSAKYGWRFTDYYHLGREALELAVENTLAVADSEYATTASPKLQQARRMSKASLSRSSAAHLLAGGTPGLRGSTTNAFCTAGKLSGPGSRALDVLRAAGPNPEDILAADVTIHALLEGLGTAGTGGSGSAPPGSPKGGSIRARLEDFWDAKIPVNESLSQVYGLSEADFASARATMAEEIRAFSRSMTAVLTPTKSAGQTLHFDRFAATAAPPPERDPTYWEAITRTENADPTNVIGGSWRTATDMAEEPVGAPVHDLAMLEYYAHLGAAWISNRAEFDISGSDPLSADQALLKTYVLDPLAMLSSGVGRNAHITFCRYRRKVGANEPAGKIDVDLSLYGYTEADAPVVVQGEDALACATSGTVEGAPCTLQAYSSQAVLPPGGYFVHAMDQTAKTETSFGLGDGVNWAPQDELLFGDQPIQKRWYVLVPSAGAAMAPGVYRSIAGFVPYREPTTPSIERCVDYPVVPEATQRLAQVLAPSRDHCAKQSVSCDGTRFDARMPLEDELSDDQDGVESSWKHYLTLARSAAEQADALGQQYLDSSLASDVEEREQSLRAQAQQEKAMAELERLQEICGTAVDPIALLEKLGVTDGVFDLKSITSGTCTVGSSALCLGGRKVRDWKTLLGGGGDPDLAKLAKCIEGFDAVKPYAHLSDATLCITRGKNVALYTGKHCSDDCKWSYFDNQGGFSTRNGICLGADSGLGLFPLPEVPDPKADPTPIDTSRYCDDVRRLRKTSGVTDEERKELIENFKQTSFFDVANMRKLASTLDVRLDYGDYVTLATPHVVYSTESTGTTERWPCAASTAKCTTGTGLFCEHIDCSNDAQRSTMNNRLYRAAVAAKAASWGAGDAPPSIDAPYYLSQFMWADGASLDPAAFTVAGVPIGVIANGTWRIFDTTVGSGPASRASSIGNEGGIWPARSYGGHAGAIPTNRRFAIGHFKFKDSRAMEDLASAYWGGLNSFSEPGYFSFALWGRKVKPSGEAFFPGGIGNRSPGPNWQTNLESFLGFDPAPPPGVGVDAFLMTTDSRGSNANGAIDFSNAMSDKFKEYFSLTRSPDVPQNGAKFPATVVSNWDSRLWFGTYLGSAFTWEEDALMDGLELMCELEQREQATPTECGAEPPPLQHIQDLEPLSNYLDCLGNDIKRQAQLAVFRDFPNAAFDPLRKAGGSVYPTGSGEIDSHISLLHEALIQVAKSGPIVGGSLRQYGSTLRQLRSTLAQYDTQAQINSVKFEAESAGRMMGCYRAMIDGTGLGQVMSSFGNSVASGVATCADALAQIGFASTLRELGDESNQEARESALADFDQKFGTIVESLQEESLNLAQGMETVSRELGVIEGLKKASQRSVEKALWLLSAQAANDAEITNFLSNRSVGAQIRYEGALKNAKHLAFLAKRAIENRLGTDLSEMTDNMPLVLAPATWESTVCKMTGIDYEALTQDGQGQAFADGFILDYVSKLENVVESYRLVHNFHEGSDVAVTSLRDDILGTRATCATESRNLLYNASNLAMADAVSVEERPGWQLAGCKSSTDGSRLLANCVGISKTPDAPFFEFGLGRVPLAGYALKFAGGNNCSGAAECGWQAGAEVAQRVLLKPGRYRFSWYTGDAAGSGGWLSGKVRMADGTYTSATAVETFPVAQANDWHRVFFKFDVDKEQLVTVSFQRPSSASFKASISGPMLEKLEDALALSSSSNPQEFWDTTDTRTLELPVCEDTDGTAFRATKWQRGCLKLCPSGYQSDCANQAQTACYREASFHISQRDIETGHAFKQSGFAKGNFNYRIDSVALNFVGTGLRACDASDLPSTCYGGGFIPYTLIHDGPYYVRNEKGEDYLSRLFTGKIEHARGLATERYLTNPLSDQDSDLIGKYTRQEFRGRPIDGTFVLRVWDEPGVDFDSIEDVQLVLNYRYWTRFN